MKTIFIILPFVLASCSDVVQTQAVNLTPVSKTVSTVNGYSKEARHELAHAKAEIDAARDEAAKSAVLVGEMLDAGSEFAVEVATMRNSYESRLESLSKHINKTDAILVQQRASLDLAEYEIQELQALSYKSEKEKMELRQERDKFKIKYEGLKKYRFIILGIGGWLLIKLLGGMGAWSPQGRIAKLLLR